jgi:hypothetical protein
MITTLVNNANTNETLESLLRFLELMGDNVQLSNN